jgi:hypothetical protein
MAHLFFVAVRGARHVAYNGCQIVYKALPPPVSNKVPHDG